MQSERIHIFMDRGRRCFKSHSYNEQLGAVKTPVRVPRDSIFLEYMALEVEYTHYNSYQIKRYRTGQDDAPIGSTTSGSFKNKQSDNYSDVQSVNP